MIPIYFEPNLTSVEYFIIRVRESMYLRDSVSFMILDHKPCMYGYPMAHHETSPELFGGYGQFGG